MAKQFRIVMVAACPLPAPRGTPIRVLRTAEALVERGHSVQMVTYHLGQPQHHPNIPIHRTPALPTYQRLTPGPSYQKLLVMDTLLAYKLHQVVQRTPVDLVHAHHYEGLLAALAVRRWSPCPIVYDAHTTLASELPHYGLGLPRWCKRTLGAWLDGQLPHRADHIVAVNERTRTQLVAHAQTSPASITVVPTGVELDHFRRPAAPSNRAAYPDGLLVYSGNMAPYQGIEWLLLALARVAESRPLVRLRMISNDSFDPYRRLAAALGVTELIDFAPADFATLPEHLAAADVAVNPRLDCAGLPQKLLNYMAAGKPIVSFVGSAADLEHLQSGWLAETGDIAGFAQGILALLAEPALAQCLGVNAQQHAKLMYAWDRTARALEQVYASVLAL